MPIPSFLGVAPDAGIVSVKVAGRDGAVDAQHMVAAVDWVVANAEQLDIDVLTVAFDSGFTRLVRLGSVGGRRSSGRGTPASSSSPPPGTMERTQDGLELTGERSDV